MEKIFLWGTGMIAEQVINQCSIFEQYEVLGFIDNAKERQGGIFKGKPVFSPNILLESKPDRIVILTDCYEEIYEQIVLLNLERRIPVENKYYFIKQSILRRYEKSDDAEIKTSIEYIRKNDLQVFNAPFKEKYKNLEIDVEYDSSVGMFYVYHNSKRLYFAKTYTAKEQAREYYRGLLIEQDTNSPHRYLGADFDVQEGDVVVDCGTAEGIFALDVVDKASKIYLIEVDEEWIVALKKTFESYNDKIVIIKKFVTSLNDGKFATLDSLIKEPINFIKMDIEGNECEALLGAKDIITNSENIKCAICSYHTDFDEKLIRDTLNEYGLECCTTSGYMWFPYSVTQKNISTRLCRGVVRGKK